MLFLISNILGRFEERRKFVECDKIVVVGREDRVKCNDGRVPIVEEPVVGPCDAPMNNVEPIEIVVIVGSEIVRGEEINEVGCGENKFMGSYGEKEIIQSESEKGDDTMVELERYGENFCCGVNYWIPVVVLMKEKSPWNEFLCTCYGEEREMSVRRKVEYGGVVVFDRGKFGRVT